MLLREMKHVSTQQISHKTPSVNNSKFHQLMNVAAVGAYSLQNLCEKLGEGSALLSRLCDASWESVYPFCSLFLTPSPHWCSGMPSPLRLHSKKTIARYQYIEIELSNFQSVSSTHGLEQGG